MAFRGVVFSWIDSAVAHDTFEKTTAMTKTRDKKGQHQDGGSFDIGAIRAVAGADFRSHRRRPVVWLLVLLALGVTLAPAYFHAHLHELRSGHLPIMGLFWPRFRLAEYGGHLILLLAIASCLLGCDARQRDTNASMAEALDCRPMTNLAVLLGRLLAIVGATWLPCALLLALHEFVANVARPLGLEGPTFGMAALVRFLFFDALPATFLWSGGVILLASVLRSRSLALGVSLALLGFHVWGVANVPHYLLQAVSTFPDNSGLASDIAAQATLPVLLQRLTLVSIAAACIVAAARFYPRDDGVSRGLKSCLAVGLGTVGVAGIAWIVVSASQDLGERDRWRATHRELTNDVHHAADVERLSGVVQIDPAGLLTIDVAIETKPLPPSVHSLVFTFNPGMTIEKLLLEGQPAEFVHEDGGLVVGLPAARTPNDAMILRLTATGIPDSSFAFLQSVFDPDRLPASSRVELLGTEASLFQRDYVALMPSTYWLPASGPIVQNPDRHDIFAVDLAVTVPDGWLVVGPGSRTDGHDEPPTYRFRPHNMVPGVALFAAPFRTYSARIDDVEVELALHPKHLDNAELYSPVSGLLTADLADLLAFAKANGIPYPHEALRIVEVPTGLRTYGHRALMHPVAAAPGVLLLKEAGFPTARFRREEGEAMAGQMQVYVQNDPLSSLDDGLARNILDQIWATGDGADALDFVLHCLIRLILTHPSPAETLSAHNFNIRTHFGRSVRDLLNHAVDGHSGSVVWRYEPFTNSSKVWDRALDVSLSSLDFQLDGKMAAAALDLRGGLLAQLLYDLLGAEGAGALVQRLVREHRGDVYTADDVDALVSHPDAPSVREWITSRDSAGLLVSPAEMSRLEDDADGTPRFHLSFHVRNDETSPGWFYVKEHYDLRYPFRLSGVTRVPPQSAVHVGLVLSKPPQGIWLHPYFSRNAGTVRIPLTEAAPRTSHDEPVVGSEPSTWRPQVDGIVVDDLSPGFSVVDERSLFSMGRPGSRRIGSDGIVDLPSNRESPGQTGWARDWAPTTWGKYRATMVHAPRGTGDGMALFSAEISHGGRWRLEYHMPDTEFVMAPGRSVGSLEITVAASGLPESRTLVFDASHAEPGWSALGTFDLRAGEARVAVSNRTDGTHLIVDAVRWRRVTP